MFYKKAGDRILVAFSLIVQLFSSILMLFLLIAGKRRKLGLLISAVGTASFLAFCWGYTRSRVEDENERLHYDIPASETHRHKKAPDSSYSIPIDETADENEFM